MHISQTRKSKDVGSRRSKEVDITRDDIQERDNLKRKFGAHRRLQEKPNQDSPIERKQARLELIKERRLTKNECGNPNKYEGARKETVCLTWSTADRNQGKNTFLVSLLIYISTRLFIVKNSITARFFIPSTFKNKRVTKISISW